MFRLWLDLDHAWSVFRPWVDCFWTFLGSASCDLSLTSHDYITQNAPRPNKQHIYNNKRFSPTSTGSPWKESVTVRSEDTAFPSMHLAPPPLHRPRPLRSFIEKWNKCSPRKWTGARSFEHLKQLLNIFKLRPFCFFMFLYKYGALRFKMDYI